MNLYALGFGVLAFVYTAIGTEVYAKLVHAYRGQWVVLLFYLMWIGLFMAGPMFAMDYISQSLDLFTLEERKPGFFLWVACITAYFFIIRRKYLVRMIGPPESSEKIQ